MGRVFDGLDFDDFTKQTQKNIIKTRMEQALFFDHSKQFKWDRSYYHWILQKILDNSEIFGKRQYFSDGLLESFEKINREIAKIKNRYEKDFKQLTDTVVNYGGGLFLGNIMI